MRDGDETMEYDDVRVVRSKDKAMLVSLVHRGRRREEWIPFSQIAETSGLNRRSDEGEVGTLEISLWIAAEKGLD